MFSTSLQSRIRITEWWRQQAPLNTLYTTHGSKQSRLEDAALGHVRSGFECLQAWRLHSSRQPVPVFNNLYTNGKKFFRMFKWSVHVRSGFECLQAWRLHSSRQPVPAFNHLYTNGKKFFRMFKWSVLYLNLCSVTLVLSTPRRRVCLRLLYSSSLH